MRMSQDHRELIVSMYEDSKSTAEIHSIMKNVCSLRTIQYLIFQCKEKGHVNPKTYKKRKKTASRKLMEKRVIRNLTTGAAQTSIRAQAKKEDVNEITIRRLLKDRKIKVYKKIKRNLLLDNHKRARKTACGRFRIKIRRTDIPWMILVDECYFEVGEHFNVQNERCYGSTFEENPERKRFRQYSKSSLTAMVFGAVRLGGCSKFIILPSGFRLNQKTYREMCLLPLMEGLPDNMDKEKVILYQDNAPCHIAKSVQEFLTKELPSFLPKGFIPANSPDLNPLDYCIWNSLKEAMVKHKIVRNYDHLVELLMMEWDNISQNIIDDSIRAWQRRVRLVEKAN